ncbi:class I SAM-dependent methyltransferase [Angustibacter peucedani]
MGLPGVVPSPNIWHHAAVYERENRAFDPDGVVERAMAERHDWTGQVLLDVGCGNGFHLPRWAGRARRVVGVEPHPPLLQAARERVGALPPDVGARVQVRAGTAQALPVPDASVDVVQARWAYFFGPGCEPGLAELARVVRRGGTAFVVDHDATRSTFGRWFQRSLPSYDPVAVQRFWARQGWQREPLDVRWEFADRADLEAVVRIELTPDVADDVLAEHTGTTLDHAVNLWWRRF